MIDRNSLERQVLSACLLYEDALLEVSKYISSHSFENKDHASIFEIFKELENFNKVIDLPTLKFELEKSEKEHLLTLALSLASESVSKNYVALADELRKLQMIKRQKAIALKILEETEKGELVDVDSLLLDNPVSVVAKNESFNEIAKKILSAGEREKLETGIVPVDELLSGGLYLGQFIVVLGEPEVGKTSFVTQMLEHIAKKEKVVFYSFEFTKEQHIYQTIQRDPNFFGSVAGDNLIVNYESASLSELTTNIRYEAKKGVRFFAVDSQMMIGTNIANGTKEQIESRKFNELAKLCTQLNIIIILIAQTSKVEPDTPQGSKQGEYLASILISLKHRTKNRRDGSKFYEREEREIFFAKNKQSGGSKISVKSGFDIATRRFIEYIPKEDKKKEPQKEQEFITEDTSEEIATQEIQEQSLELENDK